MNINFTPAVPDSAKAENDRNRAAEEAARARRLDKDRILASALHTLREDMKQRGLTFAYLAGFADMPGTFGTDDSGAAYAEALFTEVWAALSPIVRAEWE